MIARKNTPIQKDESRAFFFIITVYGIGNQKLFQDIFKF